MGSIQPLLPTIKTSALSTADAVFLVECCLDGTYNHAARGPYATEWQEIVQPGNVFVYEDSCSGIQQWNDYLNWTIVEQGTGLTIEESPTLPVAFGADHTLPQVKKLSIQVVLHGILHRIVHYQSHLGAGERS